MIGWALAIMFGVAAFQFALAWSRAYQELLVRRANDATVAGHLRSVTATAGMTHGRARDLAELLGDVKATG